ncbi:MAG: hypothetical protein GSR86_02955 [Desulfurococcales archaeon]|nr:hypothetical protein [Desulfurococcales archaeon]
MLAILGLLSESVTGMWYRAIEETTSRAGVIGREGHPTTIIPTHRGLLKFKLALNQHLCTKLEIDDLSFTELLMNGDVIYEANNVSMADFLEEVYSRSEVNRRNAIVATLIAGDIEVRVVVYRGRAGIALLSGGFTASCIEVLDLYMNLRGTASILTVPGDIASSILEE